MAKLSSILAIARIYSAWFMKSRLWIVNQLIIPMSVYIMFLLVIGRGFEINALIGGLVALAWNAGSNALSQQIFDYRFYYRLLDMFIASSVTPAMFIAGTALGSLLNALLPAIPIFILVVIYKGFGAVSLIPVFLASWILGSVTGFFMACKVRSPARFYALANLLYYLLTILPPVYYPATAIPGIGMYIALLIPTATLSDLARIALSIEEPMNTLYDLTIVIVYTAVMLTLTLRYAEWREQ
ncbi:MAG: hypothetical protein QXT53_07380 [Ignisphaera sp.]